MSDTILITGASSGIGKATALYFQERGWNVVATMRNPDVGSDLKQLDNVLVLRLDVTVEETITAAVADGIAKFGRIDVLLNNAGFGAYGPLEANSMDQVRRQFDTNVIGLLAVTKAVIPHMRANKSGVIVNMSSIGGLIALPLTSLYHGTKYAIEGISESLHYELEPCGIRIKIIEPGVVRTDFGKSVKFSNDESIAEYQPAVTAVLAARARMAASDAVTQGGDVAEVVWNAVTDGTDTLRYPVGTFAAEMIARRKVEDDDTFYRNLKKQLGL
ncbi:MAG: SDR family oxidoreductase [Hyphomicrobiales bacterium]|nr:SDR family oxidoreductase [Hyphomicrobiales bacterium]MCP5000118.1 SDR family oxidoreductase [Hyphomicrobiales bacterium]